MGSAFIVPTFFDKDGNSVGNGVPMFLPDYLDRMDIRAKAFWFLERGFGEPSAKRVLLKSQGQQHLVEVVTPLRNMNPKELQEKDNGLQQRVEEYIRREKVNNRPLNQ